MIKKATIDHFNFVYGLYMHHTINPFLLYEPMDTDCFLPIYTNLLNHNILYIFYDNDIAVGMFKLIPETHRSQHVGYIGSVAIHPNYTNKGFGYAMMLGIINYADSIGLKRLALSVAESNLKAQALYKKCGFKVEGVLKNYTYLANENKYINEILMAYLFNI